MQKQKNESIKEKIIGFVWQHFLLLCSMFFMTLGVALCVRSNLGSGVISSIPMAFTLAGEAGRFEVVQLFQLLVGSGAISTASLALFILNTKDKAPDF